MTLEEYTKLNRIQQDIILTDKGSFIEAYKEGIFAYALYTVDLFYVEVIYRRSTNKILKIDAFSSTDNRIDYYTRNIELP